MAQLNNLIVTGSSRFLNKINGVCTDGTAGTTKYMRQDGTWQVPPNDQFTLAVSGTQQIALSKNGTAQNTITVPYATSAGSAAPTSHTHGNIQNGGTLQTTDVAIASGDKLVITDSSDSSKVARSSLAFSAAVSTQSQTTKFLREDGSWAAPSYTTDTNNAVTQTATTTSANYEVLFSGTADNTTRTEGAGKSDGFIYNPNTKGVLIGSLKSGTSLGHGASAIGSLLESSANYSHAEGASTTASYACAHAEGGGSTASGYASHAEGYSTIANHWCQHVFGSCNIADNSTAEPLAKGNYIEIVGNGQSVDGRSNARTLDWSGNEWVAGNLTLGGTTSDITLNGTNNTWDGTNTGLKAAIMAARTTVTQTNYYSHTQTGERFTLPFSNDNTADTTTSSLYKNKGIEIHIGPVTQTSIITMDSGCSYDETLNYSSMGNGGVIVGARQTLSDPMEYMSISDSDIYCTQTWDGTNTHLKTALTTLTSRTYFGTCATGAGTNAKVIVCPEFTTAIADCPAGTTIKVHFTNGNTATAPTLNVNSKGAVAIYKYGTTVGLVAWRANSIVSFTYDGTYWRMNDINDFASVIQRSALTSESAAYFYPIIGNSHNGDPTYASLFTALAFRAAFLTGTTATEGVSRLDLGNNTAAGTAGNSTGSIRIFSNTTKYGTITIDSLTSNRAYTLPNQSGTIALTSDIPTTESSIKVKKNISAISDEEVNSILKLNAVKFDFKSSKENNAIHRGFIAEDVAKILPNLVTEEVVDDDGDLEKPARLNYMEMIPYLVEVCKRQQKEIDELKSLI